MWEKMDFPVFILCKKSQTSHKVLAKFPNIFGFLSPKYFLHNLHTILMFSVSMFSSTSLHRNVLRVSQHPPPGYFQTAQP